MVVLIIIGCSISIDNMDTLKEGQAFVTIENIKYIAQPEMGHQVLANTEFEKISLIISDSVRVEILKEYFIKEKIYWSVEDHTSQDMIFSLQYNYYGGSIYIPLKGWFKLTERTDSNIIGEFEITLTGGAVSCITCPEALRQISGVFNVKIQ
jgi:hypothetical protein